MNAAAKLPHKPAANAPVLPEDVRRQLSEARARSAALTARQMELAEKSVQSAEVEKAYFEVCDQLSAVHGDIERYELAITSLDVKAKR